MSEEELAAIEARATEYAPCCEDALALIAEVKRLRGLAKPDYELEGKIFEDHRGRVDIGTTGSRPIEDALEEIGEGNNVKVWVFKIH